MKRIILLLTALSLLCTVPTDAAAARMRTIKGSGITRTETREVAPYTGLKVARGIEATITDGTPGKLIVNADEKIFPYLRISVEEDGVLHLTVDSEINSIRNCNIQISIPIPDTLRSVSASSGAEVACRTVLTTPMLNVRAGSGASIEIACQTDGCTLSASSGAGIKANLSARRCAIEAHSGAEVSAKGSATECKINAMSGASCKARNLLTQRAEARASSGGSVRITCSETLEASASSGGDVSYWGDCKLINLKKSVSGSITHKQ